MHISFLAPCKDLSGGIKVIATYANLLVGLGHEVTVVYPRTPMNSLNALKKKGLKMVRRERDHLDRCQANLISVDRVHDSTIPDADVLIATAWETAEWANGLSSSKGHKYYLIQGHEVWNSSPEHVYATYRYPFRKITISTWLRDLVAVISGDQDILLLPNGRDFNFSRDNVVFRERKYDVGLVYSPIPNKDYRSGLEALMKLHHNNPNRRFVIFGTSKPETLPPNTDYFIKPSPAKIAEIYNSTRVWLSTSYEEGFCLPCLEAMSAGAIPVSTDNKGVRDIIMDGISGYITPPGKPDSLVARSEALLNDRDHQESMRLKAWENSSTFSWTRSAKSLESLFQQTHLKEAS